jgi:Flp pilus assembly protein TadG
MQYAKNSLNSDDDDDGWTMTENIAIMTKLANQFQRFCQRLRLDTSGVAAIEFAFIAPIMFIMLVGTVEMSQAITVDRRVTLVASTTADLVAREKALLKTDIDTIFQIVNVLFKPYETAPLKITILEVGAKVDDETNTKVCWSYGFDGSASPTSLSTTTYTTGVKYDLPVKVGATVGLVEKGGSVIVAEVSYNYAPLIFSYFIKNNFPLNEVFYLKPRISSSIDFEGIKRDTPGTSCYWP